MTRPSRQARALRHRDAAGPSRRRWVVTLLASALAVMAPVAPATALAQAGRQLAPAQVLVTSPIESDGSAALGPTTDTADQTPAEPVTFRSKKAQTPAAAPVATPPAALDVPIPGDDATSATADVAPLAGIHPAFPDARGPPRHSTR